MIADAHLHLFSHGFRPDLRRQGAEVVAYDRLRAKHGIGLGLAVGYEAIAIDPGNNAYLRSLAPRYPWLRSLAWLPVHPAPDPDAVAALLVEGHCGIAAYLPDAEAGRAFTVWPAAVWRVLNAANAIVSLNARPEAIAALAPALDAMPDAAVLFSHLGLPGPHSAPSQAEAGARLAPLLAHASRPNARVKLSGLYAVDPVQPHRGAWPFVELLLDRFGPSRCHWGSDFSPVLEATPFESALEGPWAALDPAERTLVMGVALAALVDT